MQAPRGRQFKIHGNVVNVPADVSDTVSTLPRLLTETGTIKVNLKRRLQYKSSALSLNIRPHKVVQAANWLISKSSLYRQDGITVNQNCGLECSANCSLDNSNTESQNEKSRDVDNASGNIETNTNSPVAETGNLAFRSTHELEKVRYRILLEQCLLSKARYVVKWKSGIRSEINGCFSTSLALERQNEAKKYRTFPFTIVAPKSTDMSHMLHHLKTCHRSLSL